MPFLSLITGPIGKLIGVLAMMGVLGAGVHYVLSAVENYYAAQATLRSQAAQLVKIQADHQRELAALQLQSAADLARAQLSLKTRSAINAAPRTTACADSPAIHTLLDSLRLAPAPGGNVAGANAAAPAPGVRAPAGAAGDSH